MRERRRQYFIKREFQAKFILKFCVLLCLACALMAALVYVLSARTITTSFENLRLVSKSTADFILPALALSSLAAIVIVSVACIVIVLFISHRIAGPLYHLEKSIKEIAECDLTVKTKLRQKDEVERLAECLNTMVEKLRQAVLRSRESARALKDSVGDTRERLIQRGMSKADIDKLFEAYESALKGLEEAISYFKVR